MMQASYLEITLPQRFTLAVAFNGEYFGDHIQYSGQAFRQSRISDHDLSDDVIKRVYARFPAGSTLHPQRQAWEIPS